MIGLIIEFGIYCRECLCGLVRDMFDIIMFCDWLWGMLRKSLRKGSGNGVY